MKNLIIYSLVLIGTLSLTSCDKWLNGQVINYDLPEHTPVLALYNYSISGENVIDVRVGTSVGILTDGEPQPVDDIAIKLYKNDVLQQSWSSEPTYTVDTLWSWTNPQTGVTEYYVDSTFSYQEPLTEPISNEMGTKYSIEVSAPGYETIYSEGVVPSNVSASVSISKDVPVDGREEWGQDEIGDRYSIAINDEAGVENNYLISATGIYTSNGSKHEQRIYFNSNDPIFEYADGGLLVSDRSFDGKSKTLELEHWFQLQEQRPDEVKVTIYAVAKPYMDFNESMNKYWNSDGNPFAEPVVLYSNVENGLGLFTISNLKEIDIVR
ncbi:MAG: DUF4249 family protein [Saprospiraceae bacterium]